MLVTIKSTKLEEKGRIILTLKNNAQALDKELDNIIHGCQQKEPKAQKAMYDFLGRKMYAVCLRYGGNQTDAQDILQEGFLLIFDKIHQFEFKGSFEGWARRIFVNVALKKYRSQYKVINIQDGWREINDEGYEHVVSSVTVNELITVVQQLSPKYRTVFNLYAIEGYSHKEIAELLEISEGTSKSNLSRARGILQEKVKLLYKTPKQLRM